MPKASMPAPSVSGARPARRARRSSTRWRRRASPLPSAIPGDRRWRQGVDNSPQAAGAAVRGCYKPRGRTERPGVDATMKPATVTLALALAAALPLRAEETAAKATATHVSGSGQTQAFVSTGSFAFDLIFNSLAFGLDVAALDAAVPEPVVAPAPYAQRGYGEPWDAPSRRKMQAREGLLLSFGLG